jgi:phosphoglycolate phosphatase-like HAD superfamily hydrolase
VKLLLFDIDGTLLIGHGAGVRAMTRAGRAICGTGFSLEGLSIGGSLDPLIYTEAARKMGVPEPLSLHDAFRARYLHELRLELATAERKPEALPGVAALLEALRARDDVVLGLLTGNYRRAVPLKLSAVGLSTDAFMLGAFGDDGPDRRSLVPIALAQTPRPIEPADTIIIGDTPRDVDCALANGCVCLAVATGTHPSIELQRAGAQCVVENLLDPGSLLAML